MSAEELSSKECQLDVEAIYSKEDFLASCSLLMIALFREGHFKTAGSVLGMINWGLELDEGAQIAFRE